MGDDSKHAYEPGYYKPGATDGEYWKPMGDMFNGNAADFLVGMVTPGGPMAQIAYVEMMIGASAFPTAIPLVGTAFGMQTDTQAMAKACVALFRSGNEGSKAGEAVGKEMERVDDSKWSTDDRDAFEKKAQQFSQRIGLTSMVCVVTGLFTTILTVTIFILIVILFVFATILAVLAAIFWICMAIFPAGIATGVQMEIWGNRIAGMTKTVFKAVEMPLKVMQNAWAGIITALTGMSVLTQALLGGGWQSLADLGQGVLAGLDDAMKGFAERFENNLTGKFTGKGPWNGLAGLPSVAHGGPFITDWPAGKIPDWDPGINHGDES